MSYYFYCSLTQFTLHSLFRGFYEIIINKKLQRIPLDPLQFEYLNNYNLSYQ